MIFLMISNKKMSKALGSLLKKSGNAFEHIDAQKKDSLERMYHNDFEAMAAVVDSEHPFIPHAAWIDMLSSLCRRIPIIVLSSQDKYAMISRNRQAELLTWLKNPNPEEIFDILDECGCVGHKYRKLKRNMIPYYNPMLATHMLQQHGSLSLLCIHATDFRKIALEYGAQAYNKLLDCFQQILIELWGATNSFRKGDILCRNLMQSNIYFILLQHSRSNFRIPPPGALEKLSDRIVLKLQNRLWSELFKPEDERILPSYLKSIPKFSIGHATGLFNPCMENEDVVNNIID